MASSRIFVNGLPPKITEAEFRKHFSAKNREITDSKLIPQRRIGYIGYKTADDASKAVKYFNRSYIRMSRIAVAIARPISDALPTQERNEPRSARIQNTSETQVPEADKDNNLGKRKRKHVDESDPRLREFLEVMKPSSGQSVETQKLLPKGESDNEYEQLPARNEKLRRIDTTEHQGIGASITKDSAGSESQDVAETNVTTDSAERHQPTAKAPAPDATDDDWLRSRTNRLLDLVDPSDLEPATTKRSGEEEQGDRTEKVQKITAVAPETSNDMTGDETEAGALDLGADATMEAIRRTSRLFVRNLPYSATEDDIRDTFKSFGTLEEVHLPCDAAGSSKGFALVLFADPSRAVEAFQAMDGATFQGRLLHIIPANAKRALRLDEFQISKLPLKKQNLIRKKTEAASNSFNWNALYMNQDAVNTSVANRLGVSKAELLDPTSADAAVKQAIAETTVIQETKAYFTANGVDLEAFNTHQRGDMSILVKNFPHGTTIEELRKLFEEFGSVIQVLMPPSGTIAIVQFAQASHAKTAFGKLAYRRIKDSVLFLERAPKDLFHGVPVAKIVAPTDSSLGHSKQSVKDLLSRGDEADEEEVDTTSLFIRNLNFTTTTSRLAEAFEALDGFVSARVKTKMDAKKPGQTLSMGFGFVEFRSKSQAQAALKVMDDFELDGHTLAVKASHKGHDAAEERRREDKARKAAGQRTKIIIKNLPFQATKKDVRALFGTYGQLRSIRVPKKVDYTSRGFAFAEFITPREAESALNALRDTHLLGRRLVLDFADAEAVDAEEEIEKMQRKVGGQVNKVALQQLTGGGRKRVNIGDNEEDELEG